jgi:hypothetical protein
MRKHSSGNLSIPLSKMGGYLGQQFRKDTLQGADLAYVKQNFKFSSHDFWLEKHFNFFKEIH